MAAQVTSFCAAGVICKLLRINEQVMIDTFTCSMLGGLCLQGLLVGCVNHTQRTSCYSLV
jgi:hypothetical protein